MDLKKRTNKTMALPLKRLGSRKGFGLNEVIGIAAGIIIAAAIVIPGLRQFAQSLLDKLDNWWSTMANNVFSG
jgi:hypothetical protein